MYKAISKNVISDLNLFLGDNKLKYDFGIIPVLLLLNSLIALDKSIYSIASLIILGKYLQSDIVIAEIVTLKTLPIGIM